LPGDDDERLRVHALILEEIFSEFEVDDDTATDELMCRAIVRDLLAMTA
jgi:hypothetical protein